MSDDESENETVDGRVGAHRKNRLQKCAPCFVTSHCNGDNVYVMTELSNKGYPEGLDGYKVCARLRKMRETMAWTQDELGAAVGMSGAEIGAIESGNDVPTFDKLLDFAQIFVPHGQHKSKHARHNEPVALHAHEFGLILTDFREGKQWSVEELATKTDLTPDTIRNWEAGNATPTWRMLLDLAQAFATSKNIRFDNVKAVDSIPFDPKTFGHLLIQLCTRKGWKHDVVSEAANITESNWRNFEAGLSTPSWENVRQFARVVGLIPVALYDNPKPNDSIPVEGKAFGTLLRTLRKHERWNWTQAALGEKIGVSEHVIATYEKRHSRPKWATVHALAKAFQLHLEFLLIGLVPFVKQRDFIEESSVDDGKLNGEAKRKLLTKLVMGANTPQTLYVSAGDASFFHLWLVELYDELADTPHAEKPKIDRVCILHASDAVLDRETSQGHIDPEMHDRLRINIKSIRRLLTKHSIAVETRSLNGYPLHHGFRYGDDLIVGSWTRNEEGKLQGRSRMLHVTRESNSNAFREFEKEFKAAEAVEIAKE